MQNKIQGLGPVIWALVTNIIITIIKFVGFLFSGSGAMFSESIHSLADAGNQFLLLVGLKRSQKVADKDHQFGYGQERFYWALISACSVFFVGCGITVYHGIESFWHPEKPEIGLLAFIILGVSLIGESVSTGRAVKEIHQHTGKSVWAAWKDGDPTTVAILLEDGVAVLGIIFASVSIFITWLTDWLWLDRLTSILIGLMLGGVAFKLADMNRKYLIEVAMPDNIKNDLIEALKETGLVDEVYNIRSAHVDIGKYRVRCKVAINKNIIAGKTVPEDIIRHVAEQIKMIKKHARDKIQSIQFLDIVLGTR